MMEPLRTHTGTALPLPRADVDTDQIIPKQFLKRVERSGYGRYLFNDWRYGPEGEPRHDFVLNRPEMESASILVAGANFGCGSSREHAAWALRDYGFRVVIASSFADIFRQNADQNGIATIELPDATVRSLLRRAEDEAPYQLTVDLESRVLAGGDGLRLAFTMDSFRRRCLMEGLDQIARTLQHDEAIAAYEARRDEILHF
ncbi:MAG: 3-isopropylmalate dehydratase small subunit [Longimicrobiales bacterium]|nr:3-isopropylmalate dehydratase small subunit [Longimicrobiales bacterium]